VRDGPAARVMPGNCWKAGIFRWVEWAVCGADTSLEMPSRAAPSTASKRRTGTYRLPRSLNPDERRALLAQPSRYPTGIPDRAPMATMLYASLRCAEAMRLRPRGVDLKTYLLRVRGKGDKDRVVPIDPLLEPLLLEWRARRPSGPASHL
jgi:site-specific recombinase XerC